MQKMFACVSAHHVCAFFLRVCFSLPQAEVDIQIGLVVNVVVAALGVTHRHQMLVEQVGVLAILELPHYSIPIAVFQLNQHRLNSKQLR